VTLDAGAAGNPAPSYFWEIDKGDGQWTTALPPGHVVMEDGRYLVVTGIPGMNGWRYRYVATNGIGAPAHSNEITLALAPEYFPGPAGLVVDGAGDLYITDEHLHGVQQITGLGSGSATLRVYVSTSPRALPWTMTALSI
jgi:hypothetical protein